MADKHAHATTNWMDDFSSPPLVSDPVPVEDEMADELAERRAYYKQHGLKWPEERE